MLELFPDQPVYEYPQLINITYSFLWAFVLASVIAITHRLTFTGENYPKNFFQSLILGAVVTTLVMMAIGDSLARGLGVFGAMAIIRFRTRVDDPRDVLFLFAALSTGLAIGVYGFTISFVGSILFCLVAFLLHVSPFKSFAQPSHLFFSIAQTSELPAVERELNTLCLHTRLVTVLVNKENTLRYHYAVTFKKGVDKQRAMETLLQVPGVRQLKITTNEMLQD
ncbi:MAG: DUF4956 domain-containing protein [Cyclobacteriaceae bacterium]|nr:DUF4956 domain-containing protein [Cyclobacteriaceae bacterium]